ncbi:SH3 domain-containing protein [Streptomyces sp. NBC_01387]|uniref:SH3 domain-containing protein n=1 Tax=unclassified Streptomyces TaxID=2593676 RepID=UPI00202566BA|nr:MULTISPECIES: SH3 domain-containing protein [unclassified Streptomyces]MCX4554005.1 SH3 domain-containing protein [Streptomyces sp. NBC_01500]WSC18910.1 SH3 domain-containing protein [Streptomyces sp. NBC_01766]WSV52945.1 SH3 domain-containing protein [Streptomyces sp. NBC_01014]
MRHKLLTGFALPVLAVSATLVSAPTAGAATATAAACTHPGWANKDAGYGYVSGSSAPLRTGPNADCPTTATIYGAKLYYHCYVYNSAGNTWTHARIEGTEISGWIYDGNLDDGGATKPC